MKRKKQAILRALELVRRMDTSELQSETQKILEGVLTSPSALTSPYDLTGEERVVLSCMTPNLMSVVEREPLDPIEETRRWAQQELAWMLREIKRLQK
jgi:hypothetical protein